jgi:riboflavin biosynthesis pyrimidine reductase
LDFQEYGRGGKSLDGRAYCAGGRSRDGEPNLQGHGGVLAVIQALSDARAQATGNPLQTPAVESWRAARVATGDLAEEIARLKREPGKDILAHGGARFAQSLVKNALIDEYQLLIHPVALGRGLPLFAHLAVLSA